MEGDVITLQDMFAASFVDEVGGENVTSKMVHTGIRPGFIEKLERSGVALPRSFFGDTDDKVDVSAAGRPSSARSGDLRDPARPRPRHACADGAGAVRGRGGGRPHGQIRRGRPPRAGPHGVRLTVQVPGGLSPSDVSRCGSARSWAAVDERSTG